MEIVSDCKGVVDEAERIRNGGRVNPTSKHADHIWARYSEALRAQGIRSTLVRWVPSHEEEGSGRISPGDRAGNDHADGLANAHARLIGPTAPQASRYDRRAEQLEAIQGVQLKVLTAVQDTDPRGTQDRGPRARAARAADPVPASRKKCHLPTLQAGDLRTWGPHLIAPHGTQGFRCVACARVANHKRARGPSRVPGGLALLDPCNPAARGSSGIGLSRPGGGGKVRAVTRSSGTIPRNMTAGGFVCDVASTTSGSAT